MEQFLRTQNVATKTLEAALEAALDAWAIGHLALTEEPGDELPDAARIAAHRSEQLGATSIEAAVLEHTSAFPAAWRALREADIRSGLETK